MTKDKVVLSGTAVITVLLAIALAGYLTGGWNVGPEEFVLASAEEGLTASEYDDRILELDREAVDNAYRDKIEQLFAVWLRDPTGQPARAITGARQARKAYIDVRRAIDKSEADLRKLKELKK